MVGLPSTRILCWSIVSTESPRSYLLLLQICSDRQNSTSPSLPFPWRARNVMATSKRNSTMPVDDKTPRRSSADHRDRRLTKEQELDERLRAEALGQHAPGKNRVITLPTWPPKLSERRLQFITKQATSWAIAHSFVLIPADPNAGQVDLAAIAPPATRAQPAPLSLFPTPFPRRLYQQANSLQNMLNSLYMRVALDWPFLDRVIGESVVHVDEFQGWLYHFWKRTRDEIYAVSRSFRSAL
jgi:hypothetical protein